MTMRKKEISVCLVFLSSLREIGIRTIRPIFLAELFNYFYTIWPSAELYFFLLYLSIYQMQQLNKSHLAKNCCLFLFGYVFFFSMVSKYGIKVWYQRKLEKYFQS